MFNEEDLESEAMLVRSDGETPVPLDRLQVSFSTPKCLMLQELYRG
jgi:hypothetical protein